MYVAQSNDLNFNVNIQHQDDLIRVRSSRKENRSPPPGQKPNQIKMYNLHYEINEDMLSVRVR